MANTTGEEPVPLGSSRSEERWRRTLRDGHSIHRAFQLLFKHLPSSPRCRLCYSPFGGVGGRIVGLAGFRPSRKNPNLCVFCCERKPIGGVELEIAVLFADVRGSTSIGERLGAREFASLMNRFYQVATDVLIQHDAVVDKLIGDEVMALFIPGFAGQRFRERAASAGAALLAAVGYGATDVWLPLGVGIHAGLAWVGNVGGEDIADFTALGDTVNTAARLQAIAAPGQIVMSDTVYQEAEHLFPGLDEVMLSVKGKQSGLRARVFSMTPVS